MSSSTTTIVSDRGMRRTFGRDVSRTRRTLRIQLWSYNYAPEPIGIGPVSAEWAKAMSKRGNIVEVVAAHPHYPSGEWGRTARPYREERDGIRLIRLPIWDGRASARARLRQELTFAAAQTMAVPFLNRPDVLVSVSPSFPALAPAAIAAAARRLPWVLWLQDLLPDGALNTGLLRPGSIANAARFLETRSYRAAERIVLISEAHRSRLAARGVEPEKLRVITNPSTLGSGPRSAGAVHFEQPRVLSMGNIGLSQGLAPLTRAFEASRELAERGVTLHFAGDGVQADAVRSEIRSDRTRVLGIIPDRIHDELRRATVGLVGQRREAGEFNMPSRLMNFMSHGIPVIAVVDTDSEVARVIQESDGGWVVDAREPEAFPRRLAKILDDPSEVVLRGERAWRYAEAHFTAEGTAAKFDAVLQEAVESHRRRTQPQGKVQP